jgi:DUF1680 family protein
MKGHTNEQQELHNLMVSPRFSFIQPDHFLSVGGFLGERFQANRMARLKNPLLSEEFISRHERKDHMAWFWLGEQIGKWFDAAAYTALITRDDSLSARVEELLARLEKTQEEDGAISITLRRYRSPARGMELYEYYYVLHGLLVCAELLNSDKALAIARRLGEYIIHTWGPDAGQIPLAGRFPGNGHGGGEGTLILEPIVLLGIRTGDPCFIEWGEKILAKWDEWLDAYPESRFTCGYTMMKEFAAGLRDVDELRPGIHAHTFHMTLLGIAALYNATGKPEYRDVVMGAVNRLKDEWIFLTGGMSSSEGYVPRRFYHARNEVEVCPQHTWILLLEHAYRWTGEAVYLAEIERDLFNHFLAAQLADGSNWSYMTPLNGRAQEPESPNCCNAAGHRIAGRMPVYLYGLRDGAPAVLMFSESEAELHPEGLPALKLRQSTNFPSDGQVQIEVTPERPARFPLHIRIPPYAQGASVQVNGETVQPAQAGAFLVIEREWTAGDRVSLHLPFPITCQANNRMTAVVRGPLVYAYFQNLQDDPVVYVGGRRGMYPEDVTLLLDPAGGVLPLEEQPVKPGLLGPGLRTAGIFKSRPPLFSTPRGNAKLDDDTRQTYLLLPFANQGAVRGDYQVFLDYVKPAEAD